MTLTATHTPLTDRFARLFDGLGRALDSEGTKGRIEDWLCAGGRWKWLAAPVAFLMRICARRRRQEADLLVEQIKLLMEQFVAVLREAEARKAAEPPAAPSVESPEMGSAPLRISALSAVRDSNRRGREGAQRVRPAPDVAMIVAPRPARGIRRWNAPRGYLRAQTPFARSLAVEPRGTGPPHGLRVGDWAIAKGVVCPYCCDITMT
jgi:hypothetical protein